jgi:glycosyltransferase involved in cell wall biosynthesis
MGHDRRNIAFIPYVVAGHPIGLAKCLANKGYNVRFWTLENSKFKYGKWNSVFSPGDKYFAREIKRLVALVKVIYWADVVHCSFGSTLAGNLSISREIAEARFGSRNWFVKTYWKAFFSAELKIYKIMGKKLVMDFQGDDIRQANFQLINYDYSLAQVVDGSYYEKTTDEHKRWKLEKMIKSGFSFNAITPDLLNYLPDNANYLPESNVQIPANVRDRFRSEKEVFEIVHAPSNRKVKGTEFIINAVQELQREGYRINLSIVEGVDNSLVTELYDQADLAIDQLRTGWYGRFAVECMSLGTPVISYVRQSDLDLVPLEMAQDLPIQIADEISLTSVIRRVLELDLVEYQRLSQRSYQYVTKWHNPEKISDSLVEIYKS